MTEEVPNIALLGKAGAGKSTAAECLERDFALRYKRYSIAEPLKNIAASLWGHAARTDREKLQRLGVAVREIDPDTWINLLVARAEARYDRGDGPVVVDDCRFPNELDALQRAGFVTVRIVAAREDRIVRLRAIGKLQDEGQLEHVSETALDDYRADYFIENGNDRGQDDLRRQLAAILTRERERR